MKQIRTLRLKLNSFTKRDFDTFVNEMLTDPRVVKFYYSYQDVDSVDEIRVKATKDFWEHFEHSRRKHGSDVWAARQSNDERDLVGWCGILHTDYSLKYGGPELQYMIAGNAQGKGYATEFATEVLHYGKNSGLDSVIAIVDIPNTGSIRVLQKLEFRFIGKINAYGSDEMFLYQKDLA